MKVIGPGQIMAAAVRAKKPGRTASGSFVDELDDTPGVEAKPALGASVMVGSALALLSLQEMPDATTGRSRGLARAGDMLKGLEDIHQGLLLGAIPESRMRSLAAMVRQSRGGIADPRLASLLDDIELRVEVELAKLEMSRA